MRLLKILAAGAAGLGLLAIVSKANKEEQARKSCVCEFDGAVTEDTFQTIVRSAAKPIRRLKVLEIDGPVVKCSVRSSSGISTWEFTLDFNDYGEITGKCWVKSENNESTIPTVLRDRIQEELESLL
jgi:hypothetical protein